MTEKPSWLTQQWRGFGRGLGQLLDWSGLGDSRQGLSNTVHDLVGLALLIGLPIATIAISIVHWHLYRIYVPGYEALAPVATLLVIVLTVLYARTRAETGRTAWPALAAIVAIGCLHVALAYTQQERAGDLRDAAAFEASQRRAEIETQLRDLRDRAAPYDATPATEDLERAVRLLRREQTKDGSNRLDVEACLPGTADQQPSLWCADYVRAVASVRQGQARDEMQAKITDLEIEAAKLNSTEAVESAGTGVTARDEFRVAVAILMELMLSGGWLYVAGQAEAARAARARAVIERGAQAAAFAAELQRIAGGELDRRASEVAAAQDRAQAQAERVEALAARATRQHVAWEEQPDGRWLETATGRVWTMTELGGNHIALAGYQAAVSAGRVAYAGLTGMPSPGGGS